MTHIELNSGPVSAYLRKTIRLWLGLKNTQAIEIPEMPDSLRRLFLRVEEYDKKHRDQWGEWEHSFSLNYQEGRLWIPEVDYWVSGIREGLRQGKVPLERLWPDNYDFAVCLTHDVDLISEQATFGQKIREIRKHLSDKSDVTPGTPSRRLSDLARPLVRSAITKNYSHPSTERTIEVALEIEREFGVVSSFFFAVCPLRKYSKYDCVYSLYDPCKFRGKNIRVFEMMRIMSEEGFDIGLHGSYYSATDAEMLKEQRKMIEDAIGKEVITTRQHWLNWDINTTPRNQYNAGLLVDSSLGFNRNIGFRSGTALPYHFFDVLNQETIPLLEVPVIIHEGALFGSNALEYDLEMSLDVVRRLIDRIAETNACLAIVLHPHSFLDKACEELYRWVLHYCVERNGWPTSLKGIYEWWKKRERVLEE